MSNPTPEARAQHLANPDLDLRCTEAALRMLGIPYERKPMNGLHVLSDIRRAGFRCELLDVTEGGNYSGPDMRLDRFVAEHPTGSYYIVTAGHAMALVDGALCDTAHGTGRRRVVAAYRILWADGSPV